MQLFFGYLHLYFHLQQPDWFYVASIARPRYGRCRFYMEFIGPEPKTR